MNTHQLLNFFWVDFRRDMAAGGRTLYLLMTLAIGLLLAGVLLGVHRGLESAFFSAILGMDSGARVWVHNRPRYRLADLHPPPGQWPCEERPARPLERTLKPANLPISYHGYWAFKRLRPLGWNKPHPDPRRAESTAWFGGRATQIDDPLLQRLRTLSGNDAGLLSALAHEDPALRPLVAPLALIPHVDWGKQLAQTPKGLSGIRRQYELLDALAGDEWIDSTLRYPDRLATALREGSLDNHPVYRRWRQYLAGGGDRQTGIFLDRPARRWVLVRWVRELPVGKEYGYLMEARLADMFAAGNTGQFPNLGGAYQALFFSGPPPAGLRACLHRDVEIGTTGGSARGPYLLPQWLADCPALIGVDYEFSQGLGINDPPESARICQWWPELDAHIADPRYLPDLLRALDRQGLVVPPELRRQLSHAGELSAGLTLAVSLLAMALFLYLLLHSLFLLADRARRARAEYGLLRAYGLGRRHLLLGDWLQITATWLIALFLAGGILGIIQFTVYALWPSARPFTDYLSATGPLVGLALGLLGLLLVLTTGALWRGVLRHDPIDNVRLG
uniref:FtsX-like permease family protein n=1 Tax=Candidatus Kentrum sp. LPFa TaxID=2126335 RepID=A0A450XJY6_9GAMM|nr:MAG: FtsX-like permease family protein [Candidatus Kentron sp. LPFa]VFK29635.1 MAG: FtsX-like permease family protein [Candidatus Kentron sp. LPFa]